jgi:RNA polymerase sigma-70 factor (sigma-E family)
MLDPPEDFGAYVTTRLPALYRYARVLTGNVHDAEDVVHDALVRVGAAWWRVRRKENPERYVRTAILRQYLNHRNRRRETPVARPPDTPTEDAGIARVEADLDGMIASLPPRMRAVLVLRFVERFTEAEAAEALGCSVGTVKSQTSRALARLRAERRDAPSRNGREA